MKLVLRLDSESDGPLFRPGDPVQGALEIRNRVFKNEPRILATLRGRLKVKISPEGNGCCPNQVTHTLFEQSKYLKISRLYSLDDHLDDKTYICPFTFEFPATLRCTCSESCQLPPSMTISGRTVSIKCTYSLLIDVEQPIFGLLFKIRRLKRELEFSCNPAISTLPASYSVPLAADQLYQIYKGNPTEATEPAISELELDDCLPVYSPTLQMDLILPEPPVLVRNHGTPVRLILHTPPEILQCTSIYVRRVEMRLRACAAAQLRYTWEMVTNLRYGCSINGIIPIHDKDQELDLGAWGMFMDTSSHPTSKSCVLKLGYLLEVTVGISKGPDGPVQSIQASLDVLVMDPPPAYEATQSAEV